MKIKINITKEIIIDTDEKIIKDLYEIHKADVNAVATDEMYYEGEKVIEKITGIPPVPEYDKEVQKPNVEYFYGVYAEDDIPIIEM